MPRGEEVKGRGVSAAEKYAELAASGQERPVCACHGEPQYWNKQPGRRAGGYWFCVIKHRTRCRQNWKENREERLARQARYRAANPGKIAARQARYRAKNPEKTRAYYARWRAKLATINVLSDELSRRICFPEVDQLWRKYQKSVRLLSASVEGERSAAQTAVDRLWARLEEETSKINGGSKWLHSQTISAGTRSTPPATTSVLLLAA